MQFNRKGKYAIIGGSGTNCVEVINLHNRYITCSYPAAGSVLAITSYEERIAFGGTAPVLNIVSFHDPKHEKYHEVEPEYEYTKGEKYFSDSSSEVLPVVSKFGKVSTISHPAMAIKSSISQRIKWHYCFYSTLYLLIFTKITQFSDMLFILIVYLVAHDKKLLNVYYIR